MAGARDYLYIALAVGLVFGGLFLLTGSWPPVVTVQSNSMMHVDVGEYRSGEGDTRTEDVRFGRLGTIDPGDLILVKSVDEPSDVHTYASGGVNRYGSPGDVLVFKREGTAADLTVIHRAMAHVRAEGNGTDRSYTVEWTAEWDEPPEQLATCSQEPTYTCTFDARGVFIPEIGVYECPDNSRPRTGGLGQQRCPNPQPKPFLGSGFITKGDNEATNSVADQAPAAMGEEALNPQPVVMEQVQGVARGELPALGLWKVAFSGSEIYNHEINDHDYYLRIANMVAPADLWILAIAELFAISAAPVATTIARQWWEGREEDRVPELSALREAAHPRRGTQR